MLLSVFWVKTSFCIYLSWLVSGWYYLGLVLKVLQQCPVWLSVLLISWRPRHSWGDFRASPQAYLLWCSWSLSPMGCQMVCRYLVWICRQFCSSSPIALFPGFHHSLQQRESAADENTDKMIIEQKWSTYILPTRRCWTHKNKKLSNWVMKVSCFKQSKNTRETTTCTPIGK